MISVCSWCAKESRPCVMGERPPFSDTGLTHGVCARHAALLLPPVRHPAQKRRCQTQKRFDDKVWFGQRWITCSDAATGAPR